MKYPSFLLFVFVSVGVMSVGAVSYAQTSWSEPTQAPPNGNVSAPLNTSDQSQYKGGPLIIGSTLKSLTGIVAATSTTLITPGPTTAPGFSNLIAQFLGPIAAQSYCDGDGKNCKTITQLGGSSGGYWAANGNNIYNTNSNDVLVGRNLQIDSNGANKFYFDSNDDTWLRLRDADGGNYRDMAVGKLYSSGDTYLAQGTGNVGIGVAPGASKLQVNGQIYTGVALNPANGTAVTDSAWSMLKLYDYAANNWSGLGVYTDGMPWIRNGLDVVNSGGYGVFRAGNASNITTANDGNLQGSLRVTLPGTSGNRNSVSGGLYLNSFEAGNVSGRGSLHMMVSGWPGAGNVWGTYPDVNVMTLNGNGNVGIGTNAPATTLDVNGVINGNEVRACGGGSCSHLRYSGNNANYLRGDTYLGSDSGVWANSGSVGIGTTAPGTKLDVVGGIRSTINSNEGGSIELDNNWKTGWAANRWIIYNMTGGYGNALQFYKYPQNGAGVAPVLSLTDDGAVCLGAPGDASRCRTTWIDQGTLCGTAYYRYVSEYGSHTGWVWRYVLRGQGTWNTCKGYNLDYASQPYLWDGNVYVVCPAGYTPGTTGMAANQDETLFNTGAYYYITCAKT